MTRPLHTWRTSTDIRTTERGARNALAYEVSGIGPPLILLHGLSGSRHWWSRNVPAFARSFRTYTIDLPGFGESRLLRWSRLDNIADQVADWLADKDLSQVHVAGHSLGGAVAARLAARHPDRIDRLVLVAAAVRPQRRHHAVRPSDVMRTLGSGSPGFAPLLVRDLLRCHPRSFIAATFDALETDWEPHLRQISAPTLVVWGEHDVITPPGLGYEIAAVVPGARLVTVTGAGHNPMWERADAFNAEVSRFLEAGDAPGT